MQICTCAVQPVQSPRYPQTALVEVDQMGLLQLTLHLAQGWLTPCGHSLIGVAHKSPIWGMTIEVSWQFTGTGDGDEMIGVEFRAV